MKFIPLKIVLLALALCSSLSSFFIATSEAGATGISLSKGTTTTVADLQAYLRTSKLGSFFNYPGSYTDYFGPTTQAALKSWQAVTGNKTNGSVVIGSSEYNQFVGETTMPKSSADVYELYKTMYFAIIYLHLV